MFRFKIRKFLLSTFVGPMLAMTACKKPATQDFYTHHVVDQIKSEFSIKADLLNQHIKSSQYTDLQVNEFIKNFLIDEMSLTKVSRDTVFLRDKIFFDQTIDLSPYLYLTDGKLNHIVNFSFRNTGLANPNSSTVSYEQNILPYATGFKNFQNMINLSRHVNSLTKNSWSKFKLTKENISELSVAVAKKSLSDLGTFFSAYHKLTREFVSSFDVKVYELFDGISKEDGGTSIEQSMNFFTDAATKALIDPNKIILTEKVTTLLGVEQKTLNLEIGFVDSFLSSLPGFGSVDSAYFVPIQFVFLT